MAANRLPLCRNFVKNQTNLHFPVFQKGDDPQIWIRITDQYFNHYQVTDSFKVLLSKTCMDYEVTAYLQSISTLAVSWDDWCGFLYEESNKSIHGFNKKRFTTFVDQYNSNCYKINSGMQGYKIDKSVVSDLQEASSHSTKTSMPLQDEVLSNEIIDEVLPIAVKEMVATRRDKLHDILPTDALKVSDETTERKRVIAHEEITPWNDVWYNQGKLSRKRMVLEKEEIGRCLVILVMLLMLEVLLMGNRSLSRLQEAFVHSFWPMLKFKHIINRRNMQKPVLVNMERLQKPRQQKKVVAKPPKPEDVIVISPDTTEEAKKKIKVVELGSSRKNKVQTLSSVLTARSKFACGLSDKIVEPKETITNIDEADAEDEFAAAKYVEDIYTFYKLVQNEFQPHDYLDAQLEINDKMRAIVIDWLIEVHNKFNLTPETLHLTVNIIDRFLSKKTIPRKQLQLVGHKCNADLLKVRRNMGA